MAIYNIKELILHFVLSYFNVFLVQGFSIWKFEKKSLLQYQNANLIYKKFTRIFPVRNILPDFVLITCTRTKETDVFSVYTSQ